MSIKPTLLEQRKANLGGENFLTPRSTLDFFELLISDWRRCSICCVLLVSVYLEGLTDRTIWSMSNIFFRCISKLPEALKALYKYLNERSYFAGDAEGAEGGDRAFHGNKAQCGYYSTAALARGEHPDEPRNADGAMSEINQKKAQKPLLRAMHTALKNAPPVCAPEGAQ